MSKHISSASTYYTIFAALITLTALTVGAAFIDMGHHFNDAVALGIAVTKASLVILYFMHLRYSTKLTWIVLGGGFFWLGVLIVLTMSDIASHFGPPGSDGSFPRILGWCCVAEAG